MYDVEGCNKSDAPKIHHACKAKGRALELFEKYNQGISGHTFTRVIMHQGNLKGWVFKIWLDTDWFKNVGGYKTHMGRDNQSC